MNASPPILQIHLLLNVLNRFAFIPGLGEREQAGIECLGDYLVAVHRLQTNGQGSSQALLRTAVESFLGLAQWLREDVTPTVSVRCVDVDEERLAAVTLPLAARVQAALTLLDGRPIREVGIELRPGGDAGPVVRAVVEVKAAATASASPPIASRDGLVWVDVLPERPGCVLIAEIDVDAPNGGLRS